MILEDESTHNIELETLREKFGLFPPITSSFLLMRLRKNPMTNIKANYIYRGGVRVDNTDEVEDVLPKRYEMALTTDEEIELLKEKKKNG